MKYVTIVALCLFVMGLSITALAEEPSQMKQDEQKIESEAAEEGQKIQEAKDLPSTLITGEEKRPSYMQEVEELQEGYVYDEDLQAD
jgi:hypothetical protein